MGNLKPGEKIALKSGGEVKILDEFGAGGQGTVYKVEYEGKNYALKWYHVGVFKGNEQAFYENIENNIANGAPTKAFLWPIAVTLPQGGTFGYLMDIRPAGYEELTNFFVSTKKKKQVRFKSFLAQNTAAINIIEAFRELHNKGYSYQDINNGNFFINPDNGDVLICDNDNVSPFETNLGIMGKQRWMAPEIVTGKCDPDKQSDRFSLAVVLFRLLFINHPLEGVYSTPPCMTKELEKRYYGEAPVFILDPSDKKNRPIPGTDQNLKVFWGIYPQYVRDMFTRAFSQEVMHKKAPRVLEKEWLDVFMRLRTQIGRCPHCGEEMFFDTAATENTAACFECRRSVPVANTLLVGRNRNPEFNRYSIYNGMKLYMWNVDSSHDDVRTAVAEVIANPQNPAMLGFKNITSESWKVTLPDGSVRAVEPGKPVPVKSGFKIDFIGDSAREGVIG